MGMLVLLLDDQHRQFGIDTAAVERLGELGVTHVAIVRDGDLLGVVLEGWELQAGEAALRAASILASRNTPVRALRPQLEMAVSAIRTTKETS